MRTRITHFVIAALGLSSSLFFLRHLMAADPSELLTKAEQLANLYNWYDAQPLHSEAEKGFELAGDERNSLFARVSRLRGEMQVWALPELVATNIRAYMHAQNTRGVNGNLNFTGTLRIPPEETPPTEST